MATAGPMILVVDDDPSLRLLCRVNLELEHYRVLEAASLDDARDALANNPVRLVLLDVHVGHDDGLELLRELHGRATRPRVALFTGSAVVDTGDRALAGARVPKPLP